MKSRASVEACLRCSVLCLSSTLRLSHSLLVFAAAAMSILFGRSIVRTVHVSVGSLRGHAPGLDGGDGDICGDGLRERRGVLGKRLRVRVLRSRRRLVLLLIVLVLFGSGEGIGGELVLRRVDTRIRCRVEKLLRNLPQRSATHLSQPDGGYGRRPCGE